MGRGISVRGEDFDAVVVEALYFAVKEFAGTTRSASNRGRGDPVRRSCYSVHED